MRYAITDASASGIPHWNRRGRIEGYLYTCIGGIRLLPQNDAFWKQKRNVPISQFRTFVGPSSLG